MNDRPLPEDLRVFTLVARKAGFAAAADALGMSPAWVSKRIRLLEQALGVRLLHRTSRRVTVTDEGERIYEQALRILEQIDDLVEQASSTRSDPRGSLRVCSSFGFGRLAVAPAIAALVRRHPGLQVRFELFDRLVDVAAEGFDLDLRVGDEIAPHLVATRLAANHRILCAAPAYLARRGAPRSVDELAGHDCLAIKERDHPFGTWRLREGTHERSVKITGPLSTNHGEIALQWAIDGMGIILRSRWNVDAALADGRLVQVLPGVRQDADIWAVTPHRPSTARVRVALDFLRTWFAETPPGQPARKGSTASSSASGASSGR